MKIDTLKTSILRNDAHFQYFTEFIRLVERHDAEALNIKPLFDTFITLYADEDTVLKKIVKSAFTADIQEADRYRDEIFSGMADANRTALKHYNEAVRQAAKKLKIVFDTYGNIARKPLDEETSAIYNILQDLNEKYHAEAIAAGLTGWMSELQNANAQFQNLMTARYDEATAKTALKLKEVRVQVDEAYRKITERINAAIIIEGAGSYAEFVNSLNTIIKRYADIMAQQKGKRSKN